MKYPLVSVIIPVFNSEKTIENCLFSVLKQTYPNIEIIVVDDCSTDDTQSKVKAIQSQYPYKIQLFRNRKNLGPGGSRNQGIDYSYGEFLAFLDSDDTWMPNKLELQMSEFKDESVGVVTCNGIDSNNSIYGHDISGDVFDKLIDNTSQTSHINSLVVRSNIMKAVDGFEANVKIGEDYLTWLKLAHETKFKNVAVPLFHYNENSESITKNLKLHIECDKKVLDYILLHYKLFLTSVQIRRLKNHNHILTGWNYQKLKDYKRSTWHCLLSLLYDVTNPLAYKMMMANLLKSLRLMKSD